MRTVFEVYPLGPIPRSGITPTSNGAATGRKIAEAPPLSGWGTTSWMVICVDAVILHVPDAANSVRYASAEMTVPAGKNRVMLAPIPPVALAWLTGAL